MEIKPKTVAVIKGNTPVHFINQLCFLLAASHTVFIADDPAPPKISWIIKLHLWIDKLIFEKTTTQKVAPQYAKIPITACAEMDLIILFEPHALKNFQNAQKIWHVPFDITSGYWEVVNHQMGVIRSEVYEIMEGHSTLIASSSKRTDFHAICRNLTNQQTRILLLISRLLDGKPTYKNVALTDLKACKPSLTNIYFHFSWILKQARNKDHNWNIAIANQKDLSENLEHIKWLNRPNNTLWADPFPVIVGDKIYIFIEEVLPKSKKGHISVLELNDRYEVVSNTVVLQKDYHLSYPHVFQYENEWYMIPETKAAKCIQIYKATSFPYEWEFVMNLMEDIWAVDATPYFDGQLWWLFANVCEQDGEAAINDELHLYYSKALFTNQWTPHPMNPVVSDASQARPAGRIFEWDGKLYRPSQNSAYLYGFGVNLMEVIELNTAKYYEQQLIKIEPQNIPLSKRIHTFQAMIRMCMIDGVMKFQ